MCSFPTASVSGGKTQLQIRKERQIDKENEPKMKKTAYNKKEGEGGNLGENLKKLAAIAEWLEAQERSEEPDFDAGLRKGSRSGGTH